MEEFLNNFHFLRPWWLLAMILPLLGYFRFFIGMKNVSAWENVCDKKLLEFLLVKGSSRQRSTVATILMLGMFGAIVALAGPSWQKKDIPAYAPENPVMFLLNLSSDMDATDVTPNRLMRAKYAISDLLNSASDVQSGLIVYTNEPFLISPIAEDSRIVKNLLPAVAGDIMPENGDKLYRAIDFAVSRLQEAGYKKGNIVVLAADVGQDFNLAIMSAAGAYAKGYRVSVVDASVKGSEKLKMTAQKGGGEYVKILSGLSRLSAYLTQTSGQKLKQSENEREMWEDAGYYLLVLPLLCALYFFRRGILVIILGVMMSHTAYAGFFLNNNQEAMRAFDNQDYEQAAAKFDNKGWKASAFYRSGNYDEAYKYFAGEDSESLYNQGNALAKGGKIEEAIAKYEEVLKQVPNHEDVKFNLEYLKQQQQNQQQQQSQSDQNSEDNQDQNQSSGGQNNQQQNNSEQNNADKPQGDNEQSQNADSQSPSGGQGDEEQNQQQKQPQQSGNQQQDQKQQGKSRQQQSAAPEQKGDKTQEQAQAEALADEKTKEKGDNYSEAAQAREQQFRDIPEDVGGLLRAFIYKEYQKNRYKDN